MKKQIISIIAVITLIAAPALAGVWTAQSSSGGSGSTTCYLVVFPTASYGTRQLMGNGVVSGNTFSGFLRSAPNPQTGGTTGSVDCNAGGDCAWNYAYSYDIVVSVSGLHINSATPIACF